MQAHLKRSRSVKDRFPGAWRALKSSSFLFNATPPGGKKKSTLIHLESTKICRVGRWQLASTQVVVIRTMSYMLCPCDTVSRFSAFSVQETRYEFEGASWTLESRRVSINMRYDLIQGDEITIHKWKLHWHTLYGGQ